MSLVLESLTLVYPEEHPDRDVKTAAHTRMDHQIGLGKGCQVRSHQGTGGNLSQLFVQQVFTECLL